MGDIGAPGHLSALAVDSFHVLTPEELDDFLSALEDLRQEQLGAVLGRV